MKKADSSPLQLSLFNRHPTNYQSNLFTESRQEFSELEKKIVTLVVNQLGNLAVKGMIKPNENVQVSIPYSELTRQHHDKITDAAEALSKKRISFKDEKGDNFIFITPFPFVRSLVEDGRRLVEIKMLADVVPHFAALGQRYTKYDLDTMLSLSSVYAQRMFEIVSMNLHIKKMSWVYPVDELRDILNCPQTYRYNDFKVNVLDVAQNELRQKANLILEWHTSRKIGRRITELEFFIKTEQQVASEGVQQDQQVISNLPHHQVIPLAWKVMAEYDLKPAQKEEVAVDPVKLEILLRVHSEIENGLRTNVKNKTRYMAKSLGFDKQGKSVATKPIARPQSPQLSIVPPTPPRRGGDAMSIGDVLKQPPSGKTTRR